jgi:Ala-tRNA(Pro) deacylase
MPPHAMRVDTEVILVDGRVALACFPAGETIDYSALSASLGGVCVAGDHADLPGDISGLAPPIPPFGQLFGVPIILDESAAGSPLMVMAMFGGNDYVELAYEDWARLEAPRMASFSSSGRLAVQSESTQGAAHAHH